MPTTWDYVIAERAAVLAQLLDRGVGRALEQAERVARAVETDRQRGIVWVRHIRDSERVRRVVLMMLGFDGWVLNAAETLVVRQQESLPEYADRVAAGTDTDVLAVAIAAIRVPTTFVLRYTLRASHLELGGVDLGLAVEDDVLPLDRADMPQQVGVEREVRRGGQP